MKDGNVRRGLVLAVLSLALWVSAARGGPSYDGWGYQASLTFTGYGRGETLTNFPVLVVLSNNCFFCFSYSQFLSGSNDLAFTDSTGVNSLNYEIESWNPSGASYVWVQVPALTNNTRITAWWGAASQSVPACTTNGSTWSNGYAAVWHMNQATLMRDSTTSHFDGVCGTITLTNGVTGNALYFNGSNPANVLLTNTFSVSGGRFTLEMWGQTVSSTSDIRLFDSQSGRLLIRWNEGGTGKTTYLDTADRPSSGCGANLNDGSWQYLAYVLSSPANTGLVYQAGVNVGGGSFSTSTLGGTTRIGNKFDDSYGPFPGAIDEMRVSATLRSSNWVWAVYQNMASNAVFQSYGPTASGSGGPIVPTVPVVNNGSGATAIVVTTATLNGNVSGLPTPAVSICWGTADGGTATTGNWQNVVSLGAQTGAFSIPLSGLTPGAIHYYRCYAVNSQGAVWSDLSSFRTHASYAEIYVSWNHAAICFSGYTRSETLTNFPALVVLSNNCFSGFNYSQFQSGANDLAFTDPTGILNYEIESWNTNGACCVWVQVPALASNTTITAWWGKAGQSVPACTTNGAAWIKAYAAVYHLATVGGATSAMDATRVNPGSVAGSVSAVSGVVDGGCAFTNAGNNDIAVPDSPSLRITQKITMSAWVNQLQRNGNNSLIIQKRAATTDTPAEHNLWVLSSGQIRFEFSDGGYRQMDSTGLLPVGSWTYVTVAVDETAANNRIRVYFNGALDSTPAYAGAMPSGTSPMQIGNYGQFNSGVFQVGILDEVRISPLAQSSNWVWACYQNMASNAVFQSYGKVVRPPTGTAMLFY